MERNRHGLENLASVERAKSLLARTEEESLALDKQIGLQRNKLAALMGAGPDRGLSITRPQLHLTATYALPAELPMNLLGRRPDIVAARLQVEAATSMIEKQKAEFYPNVNLSAFLGYHALDLDKVLKSGSDFGGIGPAISLPIFTGGRLSAELEEVRAGRDEAVGIYNQTVSVALQEVGDAILNQKQLILQLEKSARPSLLPVKRTASSATATAAVSPIIWKCWRQRKHGSKHHVQKKICNPEYSPMT